MTSPVSRTGVRTLPPGLPGCACLLGGIAQRIGGRAASLLRVAYQLTHDRAAAQDLGQDALQSGSARTIVPIIEQLLRR